MGETRGFPKLTSLKQSFPTLVDQHSLGEANREKQTHRVSTFRKKRLDVFFFPVGQKAKRTHFGPVNFFGGAFQKWKKFSEAFEAQTNKQRPHCDSILQRKDSKVFPSSLSPCFCITSSCSTAFLAERASCKSKHSQFGGFFLSDECWWFGASDETSSQRYGRFETTQSLWAWLVKCFLTKSTLGREWKPSEYYRCSFQSCFPYPRKPSTKCQKSSSTSDWCDWEWVCLQILGVPCFSICISFIRRREWEILCVYIQNAKPTNSSPCY